MMQNHLITHFPNEDPHGSLCIISILGKSANSLF